MKKTLLLLLLVFPLLFSSCAQKVISKDKLVGKKWSLRSSKIISVEANNKEAIKKIERYANYDVTEDRYKDHLIFGSDDTIKNFFYIEPSEVNRYVEEEVKKEGTYSLKGNTVTVKSGSSTEVAQAKISGNELHIEKEDTAKELKEFARILNHMGEFPELEISKLVLKRTYIIID